ncbi:alpha/beta hydrolase [Oculatella sp. LEGE 06141]|uniref:alpha/beta hydrolase n=1 Tax=Oculatella sp. LEGE 06141 TaxID=1828648 RepID=UPI00187FB6FE|nr:alpha/beta hydrolase [Oculatella sp. LEGE 06141]MBE9179172.1 alpha/beta hydrolase [Oculatella sp. LEGE 06141]
MGVQFSALRRILFVGIALGIWLNGADAIAAERVRLKYRIFQRSIAVEDLTNLAETGEVSRPLRVYLRLARRDPESVRQTLNQEVAVSPTLLDRGLNNPAGDLVLDQIGQAIYPPSGEASREAMRSALVLSASDNNRISLIEVIQNYPTQEVVVDGNRLEDAYRQLRALGGRIEDILPITLPNIF